MLPIALSDFTSDIVDALFQSSPHGPPNLPAGAQRSDETATTGRVAALVLAAVVCNGCSRYSYLGDRELLLFTIGARAAHRARLAGFVQLGLSLSSTSATTGLFPCCMANSTPVATCAEAGCVWTSSGRHCGLQRWSMLPQLLRGGVRAADDTAGGPLCAQQTFFLQTFFLQYSGVEWNASAPSIALSLIVRVQRLRPLQKLSLAGLTGPQETIVALFR